MKNEYQVTIGYTGVLTVTVKAENEMDAKKVALEIFKKQKEKVFNTRGKVILEDDNYAANGVLNLDETWNKLN